MNRVKGIDLELLPEKNFSCNIPLVLRVKIFLIKIKNINE